MDDEKRQQQKREIIARVRNRVLRGERREACVVCGSPFVVRAGKTGKCQRCLQPVDPTPEEIAERAAVERENHFRQMGLSEGTYGDLD